MLLSENTARIDDGAIDDMQIVTHLFSPPNVHGQDGSKLPEANGIVYARSSRHVVLYHRLLQDRAAIGCGLFCPHIGRYCNHQRNYIAEGDQY